MARKPGSTPRIPRNPLEILKQACRIASDHGYYIKEIPGGVYQLFHKKPTRADFIGKRSSPAAIYRLVCTTTNFR